MVVLTWLNSACNGVASRLRRVGDALKCALLAVWLDRRGDLVTSSLSEVVRHLACLEVLLGLSYLEDELNLFLLLKIIL